jgi:hypothetical protein
MIKVEIKVLFGLMETRLPLTRSKNQYSFQYLLHWASNLPKFGHTMRKGIDTRLLQACRWVQVVMLSTHSKWPSNLDQNIRLLNSHALEPMESYARTLISFP